MSDAEKEHQQPSAANATHATGSTKTSTTLVETAKPSQHVQSKEVGNASQEDVERVPHVHLRTYLAVFAVCLVYFAQDFALVGAGSVCVSRR
jgi:hypothetical protein